MRLNNKVAIVTGGGSGIGRATALLFSKEGATVMVADIDDHGGQETVKMIDEAGGTAQFQQTDVSVPEQVDLLVATTVRNFGKLDVMVNNAGISHGEKKIENVPVEDWERVVDVSMKSVYLGMKYAIPHMIEHGGSIINTSSVAGIKGQKLLAGYTAAKSGVIAITKSTALEYGKHQIRVNAIAPGVIETPITDEWKKSPKWPALSTANALRRIGQPEEVAKAMLFLASDDSSFVTGTTLVVDGGTLLGR